MARIDANKWAISARGSKGRFANKLLVLMDGRSLYTPLFSGVYWDVQDTVLEDIDRIEVIRGPEATLCGANAVNGVISIITKSSSQAQQGLVSATMGTEDRLITTGRYGDSFGANNSYRLYIKHRQTDSGSDPQGGRANDDWDLRRQVFV